MHPLAGRGAAPHKKGYKESRTPQKGVTKKELTSIIVDVDLEEFTGGLEEDIVFGGGGEVVHFFDVAAMFEVAEGEGVIGAVCDAFGAEEFEVVAEGVGVVGDAIDPEVAEVGAG